MSEGEKELPEADFCGSSLLILHWLQRKRDAWNLMSVAHLVVEDDDEMKDFDVCPKKRSQREGLLLQLSFPWNWSDDARKISRFLSHTKLYNRLNQIEGNASLFILFGWEKDFLSPLLPSPGVTISIGWRGCGRCGPSCCYSTNTRSLLQYSILWQTFGRQEYTVFQEGDTKGKDILSRFQEKKAI